MPATVRNLGGSSTHLVEREAELAAVLDTLAHPPGIVLVEGEPGIGKTRLVRDALDAPELSDRQVLEGRAHPIRDPHPLGPLVGALLDATLPPADSLSPVVGALRALLPERAGKFPPLPDPLGDPISERYRTIRALVELLSALGPAVLVLEDLHWTDHLTLEVLAALLARAPDELGVVLTYRGVDALPGSPLHAALVDLPRELPKIHVHLQPLSIEGVARLAAALLGIDSVSEEFSNFLYDRSGGIPFVVEEDVQLLVERREVVRREGTWVRRGVGELSVPPSVGDAVVERVAELSPSGRAALEAVAVIGMNADESIVAHVSGLDPIETASGLSEGLKCGLLLEQGGHIVFRHTLARQAVYDAITGPRRRVLHNAAALYLEASGEAGSLGRLVHHHRMAGNEEAWARCAEAAAQLAYSLGEHATAYWYLRELLESDAVPFARRAELTLLFGETARTSPGEHGANIALLERALTTHNSDPPLRGELRLWLACHRFDDPETLDLAADDFRAAINDLDARPHLKALALSKLANPWRRRKGTLSEHMSCLEAAQTVANSDPRTVLAAGDIVWSLMGLGDPGAWAAFQALPAPGPSVSDHLALVRAHYNVAHTALDNGYYDRSIDAAAQGRRLLSKLHPDCRFITEFRAAELRARWFTSDLEGVEEDAQDLRRSHDSCVALDSDLILAEMALERGAIAKAHRLLSDVAVRQERVAELARMARTYAGLARIAVALGSPDDAARTSQHMIDLVNAKEIWFWAAPLLPFAPLEVVRPVLDEYRKGIADRDAPLARAALSFVDGRIAEEAGDFSLAAARYERAQDLYSALPDPRISAHAAAAEGRCRIQIREEPGEALLRHAWQSFTEVDAPWEANRVKQFMRRAGLQVPHRRGRRGYGTELSPREREVAQGAAQGSTNREIAEQLFLSARTVEYHLANAMRKLHVSTRRELPEALRGLPTS